LGWEERAVTAIAHSIQPNRVEIIFAIIGKTQQIAEFIPGASVTVGVRNFHPLIANTCRSTPIGASKGIRIDGSSKGNPTSKTIDPGAIAIGKFNLIVTIVKNKGDGTTPGAVNGVGQSGGTASNPGIGKAHICEEFPLACLDFSPQGLIISP